METTARHIQVYGLVQGVGFRPFIYRHATRLGLKGWVRNHMAGVNIHVEGTHDQCLRFVETIRDHAPEASSVLSVHSREVNELGLHQFEILKSENGHDKITDVSPDIAVCYNCMQDMEVQQRRLHYPFTNCTHCGPRFSIIRQIPYDRANTSMESFTMCDSCRMEYNDVMDRRFHAQPVSCNLCGPEYSWIEGDYVITNWQGVSDKLLAYLEQGKIICLKSTGGFQLICDASNDESINRLRQIKQRKNRPFAVMFRDIKTLNHFAYISDEEKNILTSWRRPVVLLREKKALSPLVNKGLDTVGAILPYTPLQHIIMKQLQTPALVFTSANFNNQPLISRNQDAIAFYEQGGCDAVVIHNREIVNSTDDSVVKVRQAGVNLIRRSRGYTPEPVYLNTNTEGILALGADLKNSFCIGKDQKAIISQYMGDLENYDVYERFTKNIDALSSLFHFKPEIIVHDLHPGYFSTKLAENLVFKNDYKSVRTIAVQHHHAHIASVMAEYNLDEKIIGVAMDGTGYGDDGKIWGSEFMVCDLNDYQRILHLKYMPLPGGEAAIREPWRLAVALGYEAFSKGFVNLNLEFHNVIPKVQQMLTIKAIEADLNISWSCGMGRLFDAVAALLNLVHVSGFEGEAPMKLESICKHTNDLYPVKIDGDEIQYNNIIIGVISDLLNNIPKAEISGRFHNTVAKIICDGIKVLSDKNGIKKIALSGGVFQNKILTDKVWNDLMNNGYIVFTNQKLPCNDGGVSLGQMAIATKKSALCV